MYEVRAVLEGLAFRKAAEVNSERAREAGRKFIELGRKAVKGRSVPAMIDADRKFHDFIYELSENPLIAPAMQSQWSYTQRVMGEVLMRDERPPRHLGPARSPARGGVGGAGRAGREAWLASTSARPPRS
jgi:DNA-binding GntR family transcriptional regulator